MKKILSLVTILILGCSSEKELKYWQAVDLPDNFKDAYITAVYVEDDLIMVGTLSNGMIISKDNGEKWQTPETGSDHVLHITHFDSDGKYLIAGTSGGGFFYSGDYGKSWKNYGHDYFNGRFLFVTDVVYSDKKWYIGTTDGIMVIEKDSFKQKNLDSLSFNVLDINDGLNSNYIYDIFVNNDKLYVGTMSGLSVSFDGGEGWVSSSPSGKFTADGVINCRVKSIEVIKDTWYAGTDDGLFYSEDRGLNWNDISRNLPSVYIRDIYVSESEAVWIAAYGGIAITRNGGQSYSVFKKTSGFYGDDLNCLAETEDSRLLAGTSRGLYTMTDKIPPLHDYPSAEASFDRPEKPEHNWLIRPFGSPDNIMVDQTQLFASNNFADGGVAKGLIYNNSDGARVRAVDYGTIVYKNSRDGHLVLKVENKYDDYFIYAHYYNLKEIYPSLGKYVQRGTPIGAVGRMKSTGSNHLYFEISLSFDDDSNIPSNPVNPELWVYPLPGCGTIIGSIVDSLGQPIPGLSIKGVGKPLPSETPYTQSLTYSYDLLPDPYYNENFVIGDVPAGDYVIWTESEGVRSAARVTVKPSKVTIVTLIVNYAAEIE